MAPGQVIRPGASKAGAWLSPFRRWHSHSVPGKLTAKFMQPIQSNRTAALAAGATSPGRAVRLAVGCCLRSLCGLLLLPLGFSSLALRAAELIGAPHVEGVFRGFDPKTRAFGASHADGTTKTFFKPESRDYSDRQPGTPVKPGDLRFP